MDIYHVMLDKKANNLQLFFINKWLPSLGENIYKSVFEKNIGPNSNKSGCPPNLVFSSFNKDFWAAFQL
ncbi:hypothetical protein EG68_01247 [Paragonimus skrjabini miyazakii]|uniref:Uncharacterized protein n=1 Tax=Paragonimus skrjabini miyazakii TaxID=59628 RepID=A0A8S9ZB87_9TREM|nr:hypothetical protein EG68_01247 [Paragonimus skrjabini miyazakii]